MQGFGFLKNINKLVEATEDTSKLDLVSLDPLTDEQNKQLNKVVVPTLATDKYKASGSAGNLPDDSLDNTKEPQLGSAANGEGTPQLDGLGGGLGKEFDSGLTECDAGAVVDEEPMKTAKDRTSENVIDKVKDMFNDLYGAPFKKYDLDATKPSVTTKDPAEFLKKFKVKKGW